MRKSAFGGAFMSDTKNVVFRNAVGGYNKNDVNEYLVRISAEIMEREEAAAERVKRAEKENAEYIERLAELEEKLSSLAAQIEEKENEITRLSEEKTERDVTEDTVSEDLGESLDAKEALIAEQFEEIDSLREENLNLKEALSCAENDKAGYEELAKKAALYDKTSANIGEAIISANKTAEEILSSAREEARILCERAEKELEEKRKALEESSKRAMESIFGKLALAASEGRKDISASSAYACRVLEKAIEDIELKTGNSEAKLKNYQESIWRSIKDELDVLGNVGDKNSVQKKMTPEQMRRIRKQ